MEWAKGDVKLDDLGKDEVKRAIDKSQVLSTNHYISAWLLGGVKDNLKELI